MNRFFGMMPSSEITRSTKFVDSNGLRIRVAAGPNGWTILYADHSSEYKDVVAPAEQNLEAAISILKSHFTHSGLTELLPKKVVKNVRHN